MQGWLPGRPNHRPLRLFLLPTLQLQPAVPNRPPRRRYCKGVMYELTLSRLPFFSYTRARERERQRERERESARERENLDGVVYYYTVLLITWLGFGAVHGTSINVLEPVTSFYADNSSYVTSHTHTCRRPRDCWIPYAIPVRDDLQARRHSCQPVPRQGLVQGDSRHRPLHLRQLTTYLGWRLGEKKKKKRRARWIDT